MRLKKGIFNNYLYFLFNCKTKSMKKLAIALVCMIMATGVAMAQKTFTWGPKVGVDLTHFWGDNVNHGMQFNYQAGLFCEYRATDKFAIAPEVVFAAQGGKDTRDEISSKATVNYINIPVMAKFYVADNFSIDLGPQLGINVYSKINGIDFKDHTKSVDVGVGLGATYNLTNEAFLQARYTMGLTKVYNFNEAKNGNIQLAFGYRF